MDPTLADSGRSDESAKRDRVPEALDGGDAVFPLRSHGPAQKIGRARLQLEQRAPPPPTGPAVHPKVRPREQGDAHDVAEDRTVLVPANGGAGAIFGEKNVGEVARRQLGEGGRPLAQWQKKGGDGLGLPQAAAIEVIAPAEGDNATFAEEALKFELSKGKSFQHRDKDGLFVRCEELGSIAQALRQPNANLKEIDLGHGSPRQGLWHGVSGT